jgi:hypothetical protein
MYFLMGVFALATLYSLAMEIFINISSNGGYTNIYLTVGGRTCAAPPTREFRHVFEHKHGERCEVSRPGQGIGQPEVTQ